MGFVFTNGNYFSKGGDTMFEVKSHNFVVGGIQFLSRGVLHYFIEQPYMENKWTLIAYNVLSKYISEDHCSRFHESNTIHLNDREANDIKIQCNVFPSMDKENEIIDAVHEFELYKGSTKIEEVMFYTVYLQTAFTNEVRITIIKNLMQEMITGDKKKTILLAIVTPDMKWHVGIITIEETIRLFKHVATSLSIQVTHFEKREDVLDLLSEC